MELADGVVQSAVRGEHDAQKLIYESFFQQVHRLVRRVVGESDADDVTQDAFVQVFSKLDSFRGDSTLATWIHRVAINQALQHVRTRPRHVSHAIDEQLMAGTDGHVQADLAEFIEVAMLRIDAELRIIFQLKEIDQLPYAEIARVVGIPKGTVGSRLSRARMELRKQLLNLGWEP